MEYERLNFGCGTRFAGNWTNIDFHSDAKDVQRVNLLSGFPFPDNSFEAVYSSHVLEHFTPGEGRFLLREAWRVLRPGGILRIVVPDLEGSCREYLRILGLPDDAAKRKLHRWIMIELLDQMVRQIPTGEMGPFVNEVMSGEDEELKAYIRSRTQNTDWNPPRSSTLAGKLKKISPGKLSTKLSYWYLEAVSRLVPKSLRSMVFVRTSIGERHRWMYDGYGLNLLFEETGLSDIRIVPFNESRIPGFNEDCLDCHSDAEPYKHNSIYIEGVK